MTSRAPVVLTVCLGNICRSPTAQAAIEEAAADAGVAVEVRSAGTGAWHVGEPPDRRMTAAAAEVGLELHGHAQRVDAEALRSADLVLAMDGSNLRDLRRLADEAHITTPIHLFREFDPDAPDGDDVPDPYYGGPDGFREVVEICRRTAHVVVDRLHDLVAQGQDGAASA